MPQPRREGKIDCNFDCRIDCKSECQPRREGVARRIILILSILSLFPFFPFFPFSSFSPLFPFRPLTPSSPFFDSGVGRSICRRRTHSIRRARAARRVRPPLPLCPRVTFHLLHVSTCQPEQLEGSAHPFLCVHVSPFTSFTCPRVNPSSSKGPPHPFLCVHVSSTSS